MRHRCRLGAAAPRAAGSDLGAGRTIRGPAQPIPYRLADALIKANKRFDMFIVPGARHAFGDASGYVNWLRGDYFSRHLLGTSSESVDIVELNREEQKIGDKKPR